MSFNSELNKGCSEWSDPANILKLVIETLGEVCFYVVLSVLLNQAITTKLNIITKMCRNRLYV